jgi:hypothetical protein
MKASIKYLIKVICTGFIVVLLVSVSLFWILKIAQGAFYELFVVKSSASTKLSPSGIVGQEIFDTEPNIVRQSEIQAYIGDDVIYSTLGVINDVMIDGRMLSGAGGLNYILSGSLYFDESDRKLVYYDKNLGLLVYCHIFSEQDDKRIYWNKDVLAYAGPNGVSLQPDEKLGKFLTPNSADDYYVIYGIDPVIIYDSQVQRFYNVNFSEKKVKKGPIQNDIEIADFGYSFKNEPYFCIWLPPMRHKEFKGQQVPYIGKTRLGYTEGGKKVLIPIDGFTLSWKQTGDTYLVLTDQGEVFKLDNETLALGPQVAFIPATNKLLDYCIVPVEYKNKHIGAAAGYITSDAHRLTIASFDQDGELLKVSDASVWHLYDSPGGPLYMACKYFVENLHSPVLLLGSYFTADNFEARQSHQGIVLMPQAWVSFHSRSPQGKLNPLFGAMLIISPAILLSSIFAFLVYRDTTKIGFSKTARQWWTVATVLFGISAYLTYIMTKPKITLVTCKNCGKMRRPDMEICHRCKCSWEVPQLNPPDWRVMDQ